MVVIGKNGSGKTTLIRILSSLVSPDSGTVLVNGHNVNREASLARADIGVLINRGEFGFSQRLSAFRNLMYYAALYNLFGQVARVKVMLLIEKVGLESSAHDWYQTFSSGMRRRLAVARALLPGASVLLLDEPTLGIDPWSRSRIEDLIRQEATAGRTVLWTTNILSESSLSSFRTLLLDQGHLVSSDISSEPC